MDKTDLSALIVELYVVKKRQNWRNGMGTNELQEFVNDYYGHVRSDRHPENTSP